MTTSARSWGWKLGLASWLVISAAIACLADSALAQITPDTTLGSENSTVTSTGAVDFINGGATRGANLFHSFGEFNVGEGRSAVFTNPASIENILTRVTGTNSSNILGTLGVTGGNANLFLINPNGIIFGPNARLDVGGSFVGTTANAIGLTNGDAFSANPGEPLPNQILIVNPNALLFNQIQAQAIINRSTANSRGLAVPQGRSLLLVGGDVSLEGGRMQALGGRVELGGLASPGSIGLSMNGSQGRLIFPDRVQRADVRLTNSSSNSARVNVAASNDGSIAVTARNIDILASSALRGGIETGLGFPGATAGDITLNATGAIALTNSYITNNVRPETVGNAGNINITAWSIFVNSGAQLQSLTSGQGNAGSVNINAREIVSFDGKDRNEYRSAVFSGLESRNTVGKGGNINITTRSLSMTGGARLQASTRGQGDAGSVNINADDTVSFKDSAVFNPVEFGARGKGGDINITTRSLLVSDGSQLVTSTIGQGDAGSVNINARESISFDGVAIINSVGYPSAVFSRVADGSVGNGGKINITTGSLSFTNGAGLFASSEGSGTAGNIEVEASSIRLETRAFLSSDTRAGQGNIILRSGDLVLRRGSNITTNATGTAEGGNITIDTDILTALEDSNITANAQEAFGGRVLIDTQGFFRTADSDITATSALGTEFSGTVELNTPDFNPSTGLVSLPVVPVDTEVAQACTPGESQATSEFVVTGRGGLPPNPIEALSSDAIQIDWVTLYPEIEDKFSSDVFTNPTLAESIPIAEAQGWIKGKNGEVILTASAPTTTPHSSWQTSAQCYDS